MQNMINPDQVCQQTLQAKLEVYQAKEFFESVLKKYNDCMEMQMQTISLMKNRIMELENQVKEMDAKKGKKGGDEGKEKTSSGQ